MIGGGTFEEPQIQRGTRVLGRICKVSPFGRY
jgi:hypothetical protein